MKKIFSFFLFVLISTLSLTAQNSTILLMDSALPYDQQTWFYAGHGNDLQETTIKKNWDEGKRITSVAYTDHGWFLTMAKQTGIGQQTYFLNSNWDKTSQWIKEKWDEGYYITSIVKGEDQWLVVMSKGEGYTAQFYNRNDWNSLSKWIKEKWNENYYITDACFNGNYWTIVMSKHPKFTYQGYLWAKNTDEVKSKIQKDIWDEGKCVQLINYGNGEYFIVYCKYAKNNNRSQSWNIDPSNPADKINEGWKSSRNIAYIGGGYPQITNTQNNSYQTTSQRQWQKWREELGYGFAINEGYPGGLRSRVVYGPCISCHGTVTCANCYGRGICNICNGRGGIITPGYGNYIPCSMCGQTGRCSLCHGNGKCVCATSEYPGYMPNSRTYYGDNGQTTNYENFRSESASTSSSSSSSSSSRQTSHTCSHCGGTKYLPERVYTDISNASIRQAPTYLNFSGETCSICGNTSKHWHWPCHYCGYTGKEIK